MALCALRFLTEACEGPCPLNQELVAHSDAIAAVNVIIPARRRVRHSWHTGQLDLQAEASVLLQACLEGRDDHRVHILLSKAVEVKALGKQQAQLKRQVYELTDRAVTEKRVLTELEAKRFDALNQELVANFTVTMELHHRNVFDDESLSGAALQSAAEKEAKESRQAREQQRHSRNKAKDQSAFSDLETGGVDKEERKPLLSIIEVNWRGRVHRVVFSVPIYMPFLTSSSRDAFISTVGLDTAELRASELVKEAPEFIREAKWVYECSMRSSVYQLLNSYMTNFKLCMYGMVVLLNLSVLMSPNKLNRPLSALQRHVNGHATLDIWELLSLLTTLSLGVVVS